MTDDISTFMLQRDWIIEEITRPVFMKNSWEADCIVYFNFNRVNCLYRAFRRYLTYGEDTSSEAAHEKQPKTRCA